MLKVIVATVVLALMLLSGCRSRPELRSPETAMRQTSAPDLNDDLPLEPLFNAITTEVAMLEKDAAPKKYVFGDLTLSKDQYIAALKRFVELGQSNPVKEEFFKKIKDEFDFYEVNGQKGWGDAFITSYYEPILQGSLKKTKQFSQPIYAQPDDLLTLDLKAFDDKLATDRKYRGRVQDKKFVPYYTRSDIDSAHALYGKKLELVWLDPIDAYMLQVQGSATIQLGGGKALRLAFAETNGARYESIGKFLVKFIPLEQMSLQAIETHLRTLPPDELQRQLNQNPSYVFFKTSDQAALTSMNLPATDGRTVAADARYFPKGAIAFLSSTKPKFSSKDEVFPKEWENFSRFVLDQDVGGAIKGGGRIDLFWGRGDEAKRFAGVMKQQGKLYYLAPKKKD